MAIYTFMPRGKGNLGGGGETKSLSNGADEPVVAGTLDDDGFLTQKELGIRCLGLSRCQVAKGVPVAPSAHQRGGIFLQALVPGAADLQAVLSTFIILIVSVATILGTVNWIRVESMMTAWMLPVVAVGAVAIVVYVNVRPFLISSAYIPCIGVKFHFCCVARVSIVYVCVLFHVM